MLALAIIYTAALMLAIAALYAYDAPQELGAWHAAPRAERMRRLDAIVDRVAEDRAAEIVAALMIDAVAPEHRRSRARAAVRDYALPEVIRLDALRALAARTATTATAAA
jgi:hypothetical protein